MIIAIYVNMYECMMEVGINLKLSKSFSQQLNVKRTF